MLLQALQAVVNEVPRHSFFSAKGIGNCLLEKGHSPSR